MVEVIDALIWNWDVTLFADAVRTNSWEIYVVFVVH